MKKIILALACAVSVVVAKASDSPWFSGSASGAELTQTNATWSQHDSGVEVAEGVITLDLDTNELMTLTPTETAPDADTKTSVNVTANFYPNALGDLDTPTADTQTALAVAYATEGGPLSYYAWNGSDWVALSGEVPVAAGATEVTAKIELDYYRSGTKARFTIEGTVLSYTDANKTTQTWLPLDTQSREVNNVAFAGSGKLRSVASTVEIGVASVDGVKYPTYAAAIEAAKVNGVLNKVVTILHESAGETLGAGALADYKAAGNQIVAKVYVARIGDMKYETLADAVAAYTTGSSIIVLDGTVGDIPAGWKIENDKLVQFGIVVKEEETAATEETKIVAVPYSKTTLTAATLINMSNRTEVKETLVLRVYDKTTKDYNSWTYESGAWVANNVAKAGAGSEELKTSKPATAVELAAGDGVWVTYNPQAPLILNGTYATGSVQKTLEVGYNLIAPPPTGAATYSVRSITSATAGDKVVIPAGTGKPPRSLTRKAEKWGYWGVENGQPVWVEVSEEADVTVPAGTGFWYISTFGAGVTL